jgi:hypothetical protein
MAVHHEIQEREAKLLPVVIGIFFTYVAIVGFSYFVGNSFF